MSMQGRAAIVTGGGGLIGRAAAISLARDGAAIMLVDIDRERLEESRRAVATVGGPVETLLADCSKSGEVQSYVAAALARFGTIDAFFNNAGVEGKLGPIDEYDEAEWARVIGINLTGVFLGLRHVLPVMIRQGRGAIVNTGSIASERGLPLTPAYNAAKHGVLGLTRTAAAEAGRKGVRINAVLPGMVDTPLLRSILGTIFNGDIEAGLKVAGAASPQGRCADPAEIGEVVAFLLSDRASFVNGAGWEVDGGALATMNNGG
jgi:NAD(P)-dependent dehydrogenase (short-subunit alcohol dehydrogenase family)